MTTRIEPLMTIDDLDVMPDDGNRYELIEGELFVSCAPGLTHQRIFGRLFITIQKYLEQNPIGEAIATPGVIFSQYSGVIPDIIFISNERLDEIAQGERVIGSPDLVIEIVSPGAENRQRDRIAKRKLYGKREVKEYWIVDPEERSVEVYHLREHGLQLAAAYMNQDEISSSILPRFACKAINVFEG